MLKDRRWINRDSGTSNDDFSSGIAIDSARNAYIVGYTTSTDTRGADIVVTKVNSAGTAIMYRDVFGGSDGDVGTAIAVDGSGNAYIAGYPFLTTTRRSILFSLRIRVLPTEAVPQMPWLPS